MSGRLEYCGNCDHYSLDIDGVCYRCEVDRLTAENERFSEQGIIDQQIIVGLRGALRKQVEAAYREGHADGLNHPNQGPRTDNDWETSEARAALEGL